MELHFLMNFSDLTTFPSVQPKQNVPSCFCPNSAEIFFSFKLRMKNVRKANKDVCCKKIATQGFAKKERKEESLSCFLDFLRTPLSLFFSKGCLLGDETSDQIQLRLTHSWKLGGAAVAAQWWSSCLGSWNLWGRGFVSRRVLVFFFFFPFPLTFKIISRMSLIRSLKEVHLCFYELKKS